MELALKTPLAVLLAAFFVLPAGDLAQAPVVSVPVVDLARYSGKWFDIASFPMF
jgi:lipocalin